jgi:putative ABC transport system permease protein
MTMWRYILSQFRYRAARELAVAAGIALGAALLISLNTLGNGFQEAARAPLENVAADLLITRPDESAAASSASAQRTRGVRLPFGSALFSVQDLSTIRAVQGVTLAAPALEIWDFGASQYQTILGVDVTSEQVGPAQALRAGLSAGRMFNADEKGVAVADQHYAAFYSLKPGSRVTIGGQSFQIVGVAEQRGSSQAGVANLYVPLAEAQALVGLPDGQVNQVYVRLTNASQVDSVVAALNMRFGNVSALSEESILQVMGGIARVSAQFASVAGWVGLAGGWVLAYAALAGLVTERRREIAVMKAVGWQQRDVVRAFLAEALLVSVVGGVLGLVLGLLLSLGLSYLPVPTVSLGQTLPGLSAIAPPATNVHLPVNVDATIVALALLVALSGGLLAGAVTAWRASRLKPAPVLHDA